MRRVNSRISKWKPDPKTFYPRLLAFNIQPFTKERVKQHDRPEGSDRALSPDHRRSPVPRIISSKSNRKPSLGQSAQQKTALARLVRLSECIAHSPDRKSVV